MAAHVKKELLSWIKAIAIAILVAIIVRNFIFAPIQVHGESMLPNLENGDRIIINKFGGDSKYDHFDIVVFDAPASPEKYVKRIIGIPGDRIEMENDLLYINGKAFDEPYLDFGETEMSNKSSLTGNFTLEELTGEEVVPEGYVFVLGDNRQDSLDSRFFGFLPIEDINGEVILRIWPFSNIGLFE